MIGTILSLAARNLLRNARRTAITSVSVVAGVALFILGWGLVDGLDENVIRAQEDVLTGHVQLRPSGWPDDEHRQPLDEARAPDAALVARLDAAGTWTSRLWFGARVVKGSESLRVRGIAYEPDRDPLVFPRDSWGVEGRWPQPGAPELALGADLAKLLEARPGDAVVVEARTLQGAINALSLTVSAVVRTRNPAVDNTGVWVPMQTAETLVQMGPMRSTLALRLPRRGLSDATLQAVRGGDWVGTSSVEAAADMLALNQIRRRTISVVVLILLGIAGTGIANTIIMATYERVREIGTLRALGMSTGGVGALLLLEGAAMGLFAGTLGAALGSLAVAWLAREGIDLAGASDAMGDMAMGTMLYAQWRWQPVLFALGFAVVVSVLASAWPARHAARLNPADAVRAP
jgi:putative ABC transport system permease protein